MGALPQPVEELIEAALVAELTVVREDGRPVTYPLIPLYDGERIYMTSSVLFSRKLEHIRGNPRVAVSITDPVAVGGRTNRRHDPGRCPSDRGRPARRLGATASDLGAERAGHRRVPEAAGRAAVVLRAGPHRGHAPPVVLLAERPDRGSTPGLESGRGAVMRRLSIEASRGLEKLAGYPFHILSWVDADGYPLNVAIGASINPGAGTATFVPPEGLSIPSGREISLTGSHIRPQPGYGYDERRHVTVWGHAARQGEALVLAATSAWGWDERELPFFEYSERSVGQSRRYFDALSAERGTPVRPRLSPGWLILRATRLPFLSATIVPVVLGIVIAAAHGAFDLVTAVLTVIGASLVQLGLNVANDVFDSMQGADDANVTPTRYSGGSRVIQYGLVSFRRMADVAAVFYLGAACDRHRPPGSSGLGRASRDRRRRRDRQRRLHRAAVEARLSRARGDRGGRRVRAVDAPGGVRRPDRRRPVLGAGRCVDPDRPARCADPVRERDPRPTRRRACRQADAGGPIRRRTLSSSATTSR